MPKPKLKLVEEEIDISRLIRAEVIGRDWGAVHVASDKRRAIEIPECRKRTWR